MERLSIKVAIVSHILPPASAGSAMRLYRLLRDIHPDDYCLLTCRDYEESNSDDDLPRKLPGKHFRLPSEWFQLRLPSILSLFNVLGFIPRVYQRSRNISNIVVREKCKAIMAISGDLIDLPAAYLASIRNRIPFYAGIDDDYLNQWTNIGDRFLARHVEPVVLKGAARVIVLSDFQKVEYQRRYNINPLVIYNPCETPTALQDNIPWPATEGEISIVFTGSIYHANHNAFRNLIAAIKLLGRPDIRLHLYSAQPRKIIEKQGICGPVVFHGHRSASDILNVQGHADILFLPLAFGTTIHEVIKTAAPFKMGEYMSSGRPILVHAPLDSFLSWYCKKNECGIVVDQDDPAALAAAIDKLISDDKLRQKLGMHAREMARNDFSIDVSAAKFRACIESNEGNTPGQDHE